MEPLSPLPEGNILTGTSDSILAGMWRQIKQDYDVDDAKVEDLITKYASRVSTDTEKRSQIRGNLRSELGKDTMTWRTFLKGMRVFRAKTLEITFVLHHVTLISTHILTVDLGANELEEDEDSTAEITENSQRNVLSSFFQNVLNDLDINYSRFNDLLTSYMVRSRIPMTVKNKTTVRNNLKKFLLGPRLSWRTLINGFNFLCVTKFEFKVRLEFRGNHSSAHLRTIVLNERDDLLQESNESGQVLL